MPLSSSATTGKKQDQEMMIRRTITALQKQSKALDTASKISVHDKKILKQFYEVRQADLTNQLEKFSSH